MFETRTSALEMAREKFGVLGTETEGQPLLMAGHNVHDKMDSGVLVLAAARSSLLVEWFPYNCHACFAAANKTSV